MILSMLLIRKFLGVMSGLLLGACLPNEKFVAVAILELLPFNAQKFTGSHDHSHALFRNFFSAVMSGLVLGACTPNLKFVALALTEILACNVQNLWVR